MSLQDNIEDFQVTIVDISQATEISSHSIMTTLLPDLEEDNTATKIPEHCSRSPNDRGNDDDTASTSEAVDQNNQVVPVEQPESRRDMLPVISEDFPEATCGLSDSFSNYTEDSSSDWYLFPPPPCGVLGRIYRKYAYLVMEYRTDGYLLPFEILCLVFTITCCFMGAYNWPMCPADVYIPRYVFFNGAIATFSVCVKIMNSIWKLVFHSYHEVLRYMCAFGLGWVAIVMTFIEMTEFYAMSYSFHRREDNYCNEAFYWFVHYKNIAFGVIMTLTAILYIPGFEVYFHADENPRIAALI